MADNVNPADVSLKDYDPENLKEGEKVVTNPADGGSVKIGDLLKAAEKSDSDIATKAAASDETAIQEGLPTSVPTSDATGTPPGK